MSEPDAPLVPRKTDAETVWGKRWSRSRTPALANCLEFRLAQFHAHYVEHRLFCMSGAGLQPPRCSPIDNARHPQPEIMRIHMTEASVENQGNHEVQSGAQPHCRFVSMIIGVLMTRMVLATAEIVRFVTIVFSNEPGLNWPHRRGPNADGIADNRNLPAG